MNKAVNIRATHAALVIELDGRAAVIPWTVRVTTPTAKFEALVWCRYER